MKSLAALAILAASLSVSSPADATVVVPLTRAELVERSDLVVRATVTGQYSTWNPQHTQLVTLTRLRVASWLKGSGPQELVLRQLGGSVDGLESRIEGDAHLSQGQDLVLFLRRGDGVVFLTALAQAAYTVDAGQGAPVVRRDLSEVTFAVTRDGRMALVPPGQEPPETLQHLVADVTALARGAR